MTAPLFLNPNLQDAVEDWRQHAECRYIDPETFFPLNKNNRADEAKAKAVCQRCPSESSCLKWALDKGMTHGIWGGKSEDEREVLIRRRRANKRR